MIVIVALPVETIAVKELSFPSGNLAFFVAFKVNSVENPSATLPNLPHARKDSL